jgi:hypothetical protein
LSATTKSKKVPSLNAGMSNRCRAIEHRQAKSAQTPANQLVISDAVG